MTLKIKEIENEFKHGYITFEEMQVFVEQAQQGTDISITVHPESKTYNRYRFFRDGKWTGWRKCDLTEKELSAKIGNPYISKVEWKNVD